MTRMPEDCPEHSAKKKTARVFDMSPIIRKKNGMRRIAERIKPFGFDQISIFF